MKCLVSVELQTSSLGSLHLVAENASGFPLTLTGHFLAPDLPPEQEVEIARGNPETWGDQVRKVFCSLETYHQLPHLGEPTDIVQP